MRSKESGVTLLHSVVKIIEESEPELLNFVEEFDNIKSAEGGSYYLFYYLFIKNIILMI